MSNTLVRTVGGTSHVLPEPVKVTETDELIWSSNAGRNDEGKMIGDVVADGEKRTLAIEWGRLTQAELQTIRTYMPKGFFTLTYKGIPITGYRSEIVAEVEDINGGVARYSSASVQFIER